MTLQKYQILGKVPGNPGAISFRSDQLDLNQILGVSVLPFIHLFNFLNFCISVCLNGNGHASIWEKKRSMVLHLCGHLKINHTLLLLNQFTKSAGIKVYFDVSKCDRIFDELY